MFGISTINIELTSRCNKSCHMCGRRQLEQADPDYAATLGDMEWSTFDTIAKQIEPGMVVQLHWNGEPTLYPRLKQASMLLQEHGAWVCMDTNGLLLSEKLDEIEFFDSITVSVIEGDSEENYNRQYQAIEDFVYGNEDRHPKLNIRALGTIPVEIRALAETYGLDVISRVFHAPEMSRDYQRKPTMPEIGVCLDLLHHLAIDRLGNVYPCVRFNPRGLNCLGNVVDSSLKALAGSSKRMRIIKRHFDGERDKVDICGSCHYYGVPQGMEVTK